MFPPKVKALRNRKESWKDLVSEARYAAFWESGTVLPQSSTHPAPVATAEQLYRNRVRYVKSEFTPCWSDRFNSCSCARGDAAARCGSKALGLAEEGRPLAKGRNRQQLRETRCRDFTCLPHRCGRKKKKELFVEEDLRWSCCSENGGCSRSKWGHQHHQQLQQDGGQSVAK